MSSKRPRRYTLRDGHGETSASRRLLADNKVGETLSVFLTHEREPDRLHCLNLTRRQATTLIERLQSHLAWLDARNAETAAGLREIDRVSVGAS